MKQTPGLRLQSKCNGNGNGRFIGEGERRDGDGDGDGGGVHSATFANVQLLESGKCRGRREGLPIQTMYVWQSYKLIFATK